MMQSLLLNGSANIKSNDLKSENDNRNRINDLKSSKLAEQQRNFAKVMQDNIDKVNARNQSNSANQMEKSNKKSAFEAKDSRGENKSISENKGDKSKPSSQKMDNEEGKESPIAQYEKTNKNKNEKAEQSEKLAQNKDVGEDIANDGDLVEDNGVAIDGDEFNKQLEPSKLEVKSELVNEQLEIITDEVKSGENKVNDAKFEANVGEIKLDNLTDVDDVDDVDEVDPDLMTMDLNVTAEGDIKVTSEETVKNADEDLILDQTGQNALLSQIEAAQKVDTKVKSTEDGEPSELTLSMLQKQSNAVLATDKEAQPLVTKSEATPELYSDQEFKLGVGTETESELDIKAKLSSEVEANLKTKAGSDQEIKVGINTDQKTNTTLDVDVNINQEVKVADNDLGSDTSLETLTPAIDKIEQPSTVIKTEATVINQSVMDVNGAKPIQTSQVQLDKLVTFNQQAPATNNLLQEPLDIKSKHAAAMMGERVMMMMSQGKQEVQIRLDPAELGSMFIKVQVQQDQVQLHIQTQAGLSKDIIEQNMPRLREQLAQQGIQLSEATVQQESQQQSQQQKQNQINGDSKQFTNTGEMIDDQKSILIPSKIPSLEQGIDYYV